MQDYEKLGTFYLSQSYDLEKAPRRDHLILYDAKAPPQLRDDADLYHF